jgi:hypothetical protein
MLESYAPFKAVVWRIRTEKHVATYEDVTLAVMMMYADSAF